VRNRRTHGFGEKVQARISTFASWPPSNIRQLASVRTIFRSVYPSTIARHQQPRVGVWGGEPGAGPEGSVAVARQNLNALGLQEVDLAVAVEVSDPHDKGEIAA